MNDTKAPVISLAGVVDTTASPYALLRPVPVHAVKLGDGFWRPRLEASRRVGIPGFLRWLDRDDQTEPFRAFSRREALPAEELDRVLGVLQRNHAGENLYGLRHHWRANVMAWIEACAWAVQDDPDLDLRELLEQYGRGVVAAHEDDRFWEMYYGEDFQYSYSLANPGHLIQAAIAHHRATGSTAFLDCAARVADRILEVFGEERFAEHPCIEMALVELYRATGCERYLEGARHFLTPLLRQPPAIGPDIGDERSRHLNRHVVRQTYLCAGGADYLAETGDREFRDKLHVLWQDMVNGKLQITGQLGVDPECAERITRTPFELSSGVFGAVVGTVNQGFELCEAVGNMYWNWRMLAVAGDAQYADLFERTLYNGLLSHISLDGGRFFYLAPLSSLGDHPPRTTWGHPETACCPPNALRMIASLPGYFYSTSEQGLWVHLYDTSELDWRLSDGTPMTVCQATDYPWHGCVEITVRPARPAAFDLNLRIPEWCRQPEVAVNGREVGAPVKPGTYCCLRREWAPGDRVTLHLPMPVVAMQADGRARCFHGRVALMRGPLVYCFEGADNPTADVWGLRIPLAGAAPGATIAGLYRVAGEWSGVSLEVDTALPSGLRRLSGPCHDSEGHRITASAVPYFAWANREPSPMSVWVWSQSGCG